MKAQVEIIAVLGVIIIAVVAVLLAANSVRETQITVPAAIFEKQKIVKNSIETYLGQSFADVLRENMLRGGFSEIQDDATLYQRKKVNFWIKGGELTIPEVEKNIGNDFDNFIKHNKLEFRRLYDGRLEVGDPNTLVKFFQDKIQIKVFMHVFVEGYEIQGPYEVTFPTMLKEVIETSENFINAQFKERYFESFTYTGILVSDLPGVILLTECNEVYYTDSATLRSKVEEMVFLTIENVHFSPEEINESLPELEFVFPFDPGEIEFNLEQPDQLFSNNFFILSPDPIITEAEEIVEGICLSDSIITKYTIRYPMIVKTKDPLTGNPFLFAFEVLIRENVPG